ncbi:MAG: hypothetical protein H0X24_00880 [Ktedonobacterales bacterium]|nr:hypothetical protein [Ktedonobacterales bacterium]
MAQRIISSDGREPCTKCGTPVIVSRAILVRSLAPDETPALLATPAPYALGTQICCSRTCADAVIEEHLMVGMRERAGPQRICGTCGQPATWLDVIGEWFCSTCEYEVP